MDKETIKSLGEIRHQLAEAIIRQKRLENAIKWLTSEVGSNNSWIAKDSGEISLEEMPSNIESFTMKLDKFLGKE